MKSNPIKLIEDHDQAYYLWKKAKLNGKVLLHFDAHIDFNFHKVQPAVDTLQKAVDKKELIKKLSLSLMYAQMNMDGDKKLTNIGNYIYPAMRDGIVTDFYWVIPGDSKVFDSSKKSVRNMLNNFSKQARSVGEIVETTDSMSMDIYDRKFVVTTIQGLPNDLQDVLLDIDTDFLTTESISKANAHSDAGKRSPWIWPRELINELEKKGIKPCYTTIAYSVNGGYTPLVYKFLGDEMVLRIKSTRNNDLSILDAKNKGLELLYKGKVSSAISVFEDILKQKKVLTFLGVYKKRFIAHIAFALFRAYCKGNDIKHMKYYYNMAVKNDRTYKCKDNNYGPLLRREKKGLNEAFKEYNAILNVDPKNIYALIGLADINSIKKFSEKAYMYYKKAYAIDKKNVFSSIGLARICLKNKEYAKVIKYVEKYKYDHMHLGSVNTILATAYDKIGQRDNAFYSYKIALRFGLNLDFFLQFVNFLIKEGLPEKQKQWVGARINFFNNQKNTIIANKNEKHKKKSLILIEKIEKELQNVR
jgi:tetratricopeptide (TPR) repeat protein